MDAYVYMLRCSDGSLYTGWSSDPSRREKVHNSGKGARYTRSRLPVKLVYTEKCLSRKDALQREYAIKQLTHGEKEELISLRVSREDAQTIEQTHRKEAQTTEQTRREEARTTERTYGEEKERSAISGTKAMGKLYYLMGKSAAGKDKLYEMLLSNEELHLKPLVIYTTRPIRRGETNGAQYYFTDEQHMRELEKEGVVIEARCYDTVCGPWYYFTVDDEHLDLNQHSYLGIGTPDSYEKLRIHFGEETVIPLYIEVEDGVRLERALKRERKQPKPQYEEMCRRFLADQQDFSPERLQKLGLEKRYNNTEPGFVCLEEIIRTIREQEA